MNSDLQEAVSAGGVVYRESKGGFEFAVCHRNTSGLWALPKGTPEGEETIQQTALREVNEETGLDIEIELDLGYIEYSFERLSQKIKKRVYFFLMKAIGGSIENHDHEFDEIRWLSAADFPVALTYLSEHEIADKAVTILGRRGNYE